MDAGITTEAAAWYLGGIKFLNPERLEQECGEKISKLQEADLPNGEFWEKLRADKIKEYEMLCELKRATIKSVENPSALRDVKPACDSCQYYIEALEAGGEKLINAWRNQLEEFKKNNSSPERLQHKFDEWSVKPEKYDFARMEITRFGWWNCANNFIPYVKYQFEIEHEFRKFFITIEDRCEGP